MNDDVMKRVIEQSRDLQKKIAEAMAKGQEHAQPYLEQTMKQADKLRETLVEQSKQSANLTQEQTTKALDHLDAAMKSGSEALSAHAASAKPFIDNFFTRAREAADQVTKHFGG